MTLSFQCPPSPKLNEVYNFAIKIDDKLSSHKSWKTEKVNDCFNPIKVALVPI